MEIELIGILIDTIVYVYFGWTFIGKKLGIFLSKFIKPKLLVEVTTKDGQTALLEKGISPEVDQLIDAVHKQANEYRAKKRAMHNIRIILS